MEGKILIIVASMLLLLVPALVLLVIQEEDRWIEFKTEHDCKVVSVEKGRV